MKKLNLRSGLLASTTICSAAMSAVAAAGLVAAVAALAPATAEAQDYTSGAVAISVTDAKGAPVPGATVTVTSQTQGISKTLTTSSSGVATANGLTPGEYNVTVTANGFDTYNGTASVIVSQEVTYTYALNTTGATTEVTVKGRRVRQDFNRTTTGLSVDLTTLTSQQAIGRSIEAVTLLAPTTVNSTAFGEPSIGGGSAAENAYYINGLNVTNPDTYVGLATVPFDFYKTVDVQTSGSPAEFGRATGGVINSTTKSGTNDFMFAVHGNFAEDAWRARPFAPAHVDGKSFTNNPPKFTKTDANSVSIESGGALIKDKLFLYGLVQFQDTKSQFANWSGGYLEKDHSNDPFLGFKGDWYITPEQHLELTYFDTSSTTHQKRYNYTCTNLASIQLGVPGQTAKVCDDRGTDAIIDYSKAYGAKTKTGGPSWVLKYTGNITNWFTVSAAYGDSKYDNDFTSESPDNYYSQEYHQGIYLRTSKNQIYATATQRDDWERKFMRGDGDIRFEGLGKHHIRFGFDNEDLSMTKTLKLPGAQPIRYYLFPDYSYGFIIYENLGGHVKSKDTAYYIQDSWDVTSTLNVQLGLRNDDFQNWNLSGEKFLSLKGNVAPRVGLSWKPSEDSKWRFTAYYGQEYIPPAMNLGFRGRDLYFVEYFYGPGYLNGNFTGYTYDANGLPTAMGDPFTNVSVAPDPNHHINIPCPASDTASAPGQLGSSGGLTACATYGNGTQEPAAAKAADGLQATRETEINLGAHYRMNDLWSFDLAYVHRTLDRVSEDTDFAPQINAYCINHSTQAQLNAGACAYANEYHVWNVGDSVTFNTFHTLPDGSTKLTLTGLGFPKPKRKYDAYTLSFKRAFDGKWGLQGSYTYSRSIGNYEGTVLSLGNGSGQTDAGSTELFDYLHLADNSYGVLPNDRDHEFKLWGSYSPVPNLLIGANVQVISPYYFSCLAHYPDKGDAAYYYGSVSHYCVDTSQQTSTSGTKYYAFVPSAMGKGGKSDWTKTVDLSIRYTLPQTMSFGGKLVLRADIFNLFNDEEVLARNMRSDGSVTQRGYSGVSNATADKRCGVGGTVCSTPYQYFGNPTAYNTPRYLRVGFDLTY